MHVRVCSADGQTVFHIREISPQLTVRELKSLLVETFGIPEKRQGLLFMGKEMIDSLTLNSYGVHSDDVLQVLDNEWATESEIALNVPIKNEEDPLSVSRVSNISKLLECFSPSLYRVGDIVDVRDKSTGSWREGEITDVRRLDICSGIFPPSSSIYGSDEEDCEPVKRPRSSLDTSGDSSRRSSFARRDERLAELSWDDDYQYSVRVASGLEGICLQTGGRNVRPRAHRRIRPSRLNVGEQVMVNYTVDSSASQDLWFDAVVTGKRCGRTQTNITATVFVGPQLAPVKDCRIVRHNDIFALEMPGMQMNSMGDGRRKIPSREEIRKTSELDTDFGPVEGIRIGRTFRSRAELSSSGIHRPLISCLEVVAASGVCSLLLDDSSEIEDNGLEFEVTAGGSFSRAVELRENMKEKWREGKGVRIVRSSVRKRKYAPRKGFRYDGIYKVVRSWKCEAVSPTWRFLLRRDEDSNPPWVKRLPNVTKENIRPEFSVPPLKTRKRRISDFQTPLAKRRSVLPPSK